MFEIRNKLLYRNEFNVNCLKNNIYTDKIARMLYINQNDYSNNIFFLKNDFSGYKSCLYVNVINITENINNVVIILNKLLNLILKLLLNSIHS